jgi:hypothetical protein
MRPRLILLAAVALAVAACGSVPPKRSRDSQALPSVDRNSTEATVIAAYLDTCLKVAHGSPAEQAEILATTYNDYTAAPTPSRVLRYAMVLSTPNHAGSDPVVAQRLLREVLANPRLCCLRNVLSRSCSCSRSIASNRSRRMCDACSWEPKETRMNASRN